MKDYPEELAAMCLTCKAEREEAKRLIEHRLRRHWEEKEERDRLIRDVAEWLVSGQRE